jgi:hypothetical protein
MGLFLVTLYAAAEHYSDEGVGRLMLGYVIGYFVVPAIVRSLAVEAYRAIEAERNAGKDRSLSLTAWLSATGGLRRSQLF